MGVNSQIGLRRLQPLDGNGEIKSLIQATMLARGAQVKSDQGQITVPAPGEIVCFHAASDRPGAISELRKIFRLAGEQKNITVVFQEESVRSRKKRIKGSEAYRCDSYLHLFSGLTLIPGLAPEKRRLHYDGFNTGNVMGWVTCLQPNSLWEATRKDKEKILGPKALKLTTAEQISCLLDSSVFIFLFICSSNTNPLNYWSQGLNKEQQAVVANDARVESVFSAGRLPTKFHTDLLHSLCCNAVIDLFAGQGEMAQACLDTRTPIVAFCCTEAHAEALEEKLTKYVLTKFTKRGTLCIARMQKIWWSALMVWPQWLLEAPMVWHLGTILIRKQNQSPKREKKRWRVWGRRIRRRRIRWQEKEEEKTDQKEEQKEEIRWFRWLWRRRC